MSHLGGKMKRLISTNASELLQMNASELKESIKASEGRVILSENIVSYQPLVEDLTNSELARAVGADLILLNLLDVFNPKVHGLDIVTDVVSDLKKLVKTPLGVNLEPIDANAAMLEEKKELVRGRIASKETIQKAQSLAFDFICLTGNPGSGVSNEAIISSIKTAKKHFNGLVIAGKMHGSGVNEPVMTKETVLDFIHAGADIILAPSIGTIPAFDHDQLKEVVRLAHENDRLVMSAIGTSQESASVETIRYFALQNKMCGVDIQHIGDSGFGGLAPIENIFEMSKAIRGNRHAVSRMARSINR